MQSILCLITINEVQSPILGQIHRLFLNFDLFDVYFVLEQTKGVHCKKNVFGLL